MNFLEIANNRQSCRSYNPQKTIEDEKLYTILQATRLAPSACNAQPYHLTVCKGETAKKVAKATMGIGINNFTQDAPVLIVVSESPYNATAKLGAKLKGNDYRSIDIGIAVAYLTAEATAQGIGSCILGWFNEKEIKAICGINDTIRLVITLGYPQENTLRTKSRKDMDKLVSYVE